uniref:CAP-Gly domain-containing protein n=1 Tax=Chelonoidis abingdonii TaxID=106734 RepID=A0A8C0IQ83_CHEAB
MFWVLTRAVAQNPPALPPWLLVALWGFHDGTYNGSEYFKCKQNCGLFLPLNKIQFIPALGSDPAREEPKADVDEVVPVKGGDTIGFYLDDVFRQGIAMDVYKEGTQWFVKVCPVRGACLRFSLLSCSLPCGRSLINVQNQFLHTE